MNGCDSLLNRTYFQRTTDNNNPVNRKLYSKLQIISLLEDEKNSKVASIVFNWLKNVEQSGKGNSVVVKKLLNYLCNQKYNYHKEGDGLIDINLLPLLEVNASLSRINSCLKGVLKNTPILISSQHPPIQSNIKFDSTFQPLKISPEFFRNSQTIPDTAHLLPNSKKMFSRKVREYQREVKFKKALARAESSQRVRMAKEALPTKDDRAIMAIELPSNS